MFALGMTLKFQTKTEGKEIGGKTTCWTMQTEKKEGSTHANPMGLMHAIGRDSSLLYSVCHKGISVKLKPA